MKKLIAILMLAIYVFNMGGYSLAFRYFIQQSDQKFVQQLDQNKYNETDLVEISIPLHLPYIQNTNGFERIDGTIENNGIHYNYVKRRISNDTLHIMCLPNNQKTRLVKEKSKYAGEANDFATSKKEKESSAKKINLNTEYSNTITQYSFILPGAISTKHSLNQASQLISNVSDRPEHPPKAAC